MKNDSVFYDTFKQGSVTYFNASLFFPPLIRQDVFYLYAFVRTADNYVDMVPQDRNGFYTFKTQYYDALGGKKSNNIIIDAFISLLRRKNMDPVWVDAFLHSMELDLTKNNYKTMDEILEYIYGSAEVIGYFMASIMNLKHSAYQYAALLGRAMQYINFIRDIDEDYQLGRRYLPLEHFDLSNLSPQSAYADKKVFRDFIHYHLDQYHRWQETAEKGFIYIPRRMRIAIKTASDMYKWTAQTIYHNPLLVYEQKVKPARNRLIMQGIWNFILGAGLTKG